MSQITRCPACATMFRLVADQLRSAQGWVRCGQCGEVFEASLHLLVGGTSDTSQMEALPSTLHGLANKPPMPPDKVPQFSKVDHVAGLPHEPGASPESGDPAAPGAARDEDFAGTAADAALMQPAGLEHRDVSGCMPLPGEKPSMPASPAGSGAVNPLAGNEERHEPAFNADGFGFKPFGSPPHPGGPEFPPASVQQDSQTFPDVSFVREAQRKDFWKSPLVRTVLGVICLVLVLALMLQWVVRQKDLLAAQAPLLAPWLQAMCRPLGCEVLPLRRIEALVIENSSFSRTGPDAYRLSFTFNNTGNAELEIPALEVTLTDSQDQVVVRRVVIPSEFGTTATTLAAYSRLPGTLALKVAGTGAQGSAAPAQAGLLPVASYRIVAFYP
ncbi:zinc-ribbon and DUF3426 domain-containing protein [Polaromonas sp. CG_23.6]|uniref:zinc-ribbon and DUF3426 domain-containing protein n=1 Tax=Polaromonas sp. CG_23.6 TaxID=2760709 RepID=UPI0024769124|nr:zinc-ribbon and DUF3426 domain-containing protein [Polaromonas sp. CG_23.6]MDH6186254.1 putative Zn finger-like uncharacterized protein [Polaromonas sp. CG_23.6]